MFEFITVIGTGLLNQVLEHSEDQHGTSPLQSWDALLHEVAVRSGIQDAYKPALSQNMPTLQWDELVREAVSNGKFVRSASVEEKILRSTACKILLEASSVATLNQNKLESFLMATGKNIVSLNFDNLLFQGSGLNHVEYDNKVKNVEHVHHKEKKTFWLPHGCVLQPETVKLGQRDYGLLPSNWSVKFNHFKKFEREFCNKGVKGNLTITKQMVQDISLEIDKQKLCAENVLIGHLLLAPIVFFGVGLGASEWGWWWLMNQRARNLARVSEKDRPSTVIILHCKDPRGEFWKSHPAGITPIFVKDWDEGWQKFINCLKCGIWQYHETMT